VVFECRNRNSSQLCHFSSDFDRSDCVLSVSSSPTRRQTGYTRPSTPYMPNVKEVPSAPTSLEKKRTPWPAGMGIENRKNSAKIGGTRDPPETRNVTFARACPHAGMVGVSVRGARPPILGGRNFRIRSRFSRRPSALEFRNSAGR